MRGSLPKVLLVVAAFVAALGLRLHDLQLRPFHGDEANQAIKAGMLLETGRYVYDPHEHHGPTLYYAALPVLRACGVEDIAQAKEWMFRVVPALLGAGLVLLVLLVPGLGALEAGAAAWLIALSNAMVFYARYGIQETLLVFFAFAAILFAVRWLMRGGLGWALACGAMLGCTHATKETSAVLFAGMLLGGAAFLWTLRAAGDDAPFKRLTSRPGLGQAAMLLLCSVAISVTLFSAFFTHWRGPLDSILTYTSYLQRSSGEGSSAMHDKPWWYYFVTLAYTWRSAGPRWSEGFALALGLLAIPWALLRGTGRSLEKTAFLRALAVYALFVTLIYTAIPYKTPWNLLPFWQPLLVLGGIFAGGLIARARHVSVKGALLLVLIAGLAHAGHQSYLGSFVYPADVRNPYVYAHTSTALMRLVRRVEAIAAVSPHGDRLHINVLKPDADYWPLPWYLRRYERVGYWTRPPEKADADIIITDAALGPFVQEHTDGAYQVEYAGLRPDVPLLVFIRKPLWDQFMETRR